MNSDMQVCAQDTHFQHLPQYNSRENSTDFSTENMSTGIVQAEKKNPEPGSSGFSGIVGVLIPPTIPHYTDLPASEILPHCVAETFVEYDSDYKGWIRLSRSPRTYWLLEHHRDAYCLLNLIALRARRTPELTEMDGLEIGMAHIGDYWKCGIETEKKYRRSKQILIDIGAIEVVETRRNRKNIRAEVGKKEGEKRATKRATRGTLVRLLKSDIWDINPERKGDQTGDQRATKGRLKGDEQECKNVRMKEEDKTLNPTASGGTSVGLEFLDMGSRESGTNPRAMGTNPRAKGTNPRAAVTHNVKNPDLPEEKPRKSGKRKQTQKPPSDKPKIAFRETVFLTQEEHDKAKAKFGDVLFELMLNHLHSYKSSSGKTYESDYGLFNKDSWLHLECEKRIKTKTVDISTAKKSKTAGDVIAQYEAPPESGYVVRVEFQNVNLYSSLGHVVGTTVVQDVNGLEKLLVQKGFKSRS